ncbi:MAG: Glycosyl transferase family 2 [Microgenomates bacterium 39_7]|nr:MAG: Glycosyl transferase family 2 [Microgenomates bacterium 39_7]
MINSIFLSVIIPSYNESKNLKRDVLSSIAKYLQTQEYSWELILSDDGSSDGTLEQLEQFAQLHQNVKVLSNPHRGKGPTVAAGMLAASGEWRLFSDFDQSTPIAEVEKLLKFTDGFDVVIGSREISGALRDKEPFYRHLMGRGFNFLVRTLAVPGIRDTQCGFKLFSKDATLSLFPHLYIYAPGSERSDPFTGAFDVEVLFLARKYGFKMKEVPILWQHYETDRVSPIKDSWRMLKDIIKVRLADLGNNYPQKETIIK